MRLGCTTCTATFGNGVTIATKRITTNSHPQMIHRVQSPALSVFCGVGRGASSRVALVPLTAVGASLVTVAPTSGFGWFVSWISSVVILDLCFFDSERAKIVEQSNFLGGLKQGNRETLSHPLVCSGLAYPKNLWEEDI